jgi:Histone methylation protein DOT1
MSEATAMDNNSSDHAIEKVRQVFEYFGTVLAPDLVAPNSQTAWRLEQLLGFLEDHAENEQYNDGADGTNDKVTVTILESEKLCFGRLTKTTVVPENVKLVYSIINKLTGGMGGNGSHGPIYGELTMGSMQKMVNAMKVFTDFSSSSRFMDVGSGIGKPSFHVAQDPGVEFSYGVELIKDRWLLSMNCLKQLLNVVTMQQVEQSLESKVPGVVDDKVTIPSDKNHLKHRVFFECGDIQQARTFDPFTHVYMFSVG